MKKLIQLCSLLSLVVAFSFVSANAQTTHKISADVPFDFNVGKNHYPAGRYDLKLSDANATGAIVYLTDSKGNILDTLIVSGTGNAAAGEPRLAFNNYEGQRFLSTISTHSTSYKLVRSGAERQIASGKKPFTKKPETVAIALRTEL